MGEISRLTTPPISDDREQLELLYTTGGNAELHNCVTEWYTCGLAIPHPGIYPREKNNMSMERLKCQDFMAALFR